jgi:RNA recognition motif. (a.k.a. RRM, RBD, or RNP domain)
VLSGVCAAVYCVVQFADEDDADSALKGLFGRWYAGRPMVPEFSPVTGKAYTA